MGCAHVLIKVNAGAVRLRAADWTWNSGLLLRPRGCTGAHIAALSTLGDANWSPTVQVFRVKWAELWSANGLARRYAHHALNVARDGVDLDVHTVARRELREIRNLKRVRNHVNLKTTA